MPSPNAIAPPPSTARFQPSTVNSRLSCSKPFRFTYFRKNASVTPLGTHTSKTKDLKSFQITYFQKKGGGYPCFSTGCPSPVSSHERCMRVPTPVGTNHESPVTAFPQRVYHKQKG